MSRTLAEVEGNHVWPHMHRILALVPWLGSTYLAHPCRTYNSDKSPEFYSPKPKLWQYMNKKLKIETKSTTTKTERDGESFYLACLACCMHNKISHNGLRWAHTASSAHKHASALCTCSYNSPISGDGTYALGCFLIPGFYMHLISNLHFFEDFRKRN